MAPSTSTTKNAYYRNPSMFEVPISDSESMLILLSILYPTISSTTLRRKSDGKRFAYRINIYVDIG